MSPLAAALCTLAGVSLAGIALRDGFEALFHPDGRMLLSRGVMRAWWRILRRRPAAQPLAGPLILSRLVAVERDLVTLPISYYFAERDVRFSLAGVMPWLLERADQGLAEDVPPHTRLRARMLRAAIDDFATTTAERFHDEAAGTTAERLSAYAAEHRSGGNY